MISTRILDNDMGHVMNSPLTGKGTIHGITIDLSIVVGQEMNKSTKKMEDIYKKFSLPEIDMSLMEMLSPDMGVSRLKDHAEEHLNDSKIEEQFIQAYTTFVTPLNKSGKY